MRHLDVHRPWAFGWPSTHAYVDRLKELDVPHGEIAVMSDDELEKQGERAPAKPLSDFEYLSREMTGRA